ncbi:MAG TPA: PKD domain-containing protein, partial [Thermoanaerobaculia bacterium]
MRKRMMLFAVVIALFTGSILAATPPSAALLEDATSYAAQVGVSVDEAVRRLQLQREIGDLDAALSTEESATYAGLWIDDERGYRVVVRFTDPAAEARLRARIAGGALRDLVDVRPARWSLVELQQRRNDARGHARAAKVRTNSDINVRENRVELYVLDPAKLNAAKARIPDGVVIQRVSRLADGEALTGGRRISTCTSGFTVQAPNGELGVATAGHCDNTQYYQGILLPFRRERNDNDHDVQWHSGCDLMQVTNQFESGFGLRSVVGTRHRNNQAEGTYVCKYGRTTGRTCGWIESRNYDLDLFPNPFDGNFIRVDGRGTNLSEPGDSGGPWFVENVAYGIHHGYPADDQDSIYMAINYISGIGVSVLTSNPGVCNLLPTANFTAGGGRLDGATSFNGSTSSDPDGYIVRWDWSFGDGTTGVSTTPYITHRYPS